MPRAASVAPLYVPLEGPVSTLYAELAERARAEPNLLAGTPGSLSLRDRSGFGMYWYRRYYDAPGLPQTADFVCKEGDEAACEAMRLRIQAAEWTQAQVRALRSLGMQVADKDVARVLVEMHNRVLFDAGLVVVGTLAFMAWLNELGVTAAVSRTQDIDLARRQKLKLAVPVSFMEAMTSTRLGFSAIPGLSPNEPSTSVKRQGREGLRVDVLAPGRELGQAVGLSVLGWHAQTVPHFDYLLTSPRRVAVLCGGHCVPVAAPAPERLAWHKLYSSTRRLHDTAKATKDLQQAAILLAALVERDDITLSTTTADLPKAVLSSARQRLPSLRGLMTGHPQALDDVERALAGR